METDVKLEEFAVRIEGDELVVVSGSVRIEALPGKKIPMVSAIPSESGVEVGSVTSVDLLAEIRVLKLLVAVLWHKVYTQDK